MEVSKIKTLVQHVSLAAVGGSLLLGASASFATPGHQSFPDYTLKGTCAFLPAARATEFHGNADESELNLGMAGNQWVVFEAAMQAFNASQGNDPSQPAYRPNDSASFTLADLNDDANEYYIQLIPPGQIRKQIKSGCMLLGNDEDRNFLPGNIQVDFDVFASTNYNLMQDLANNGFIDEAVPYIANRLDLMVGVDNPKGIGSTDINGDAGTAIDDPAFDTQFDIIMDLLSGDVIASSLDHINEGIHNAANGYMKKAHGYVKANDRLVDMAYTFADGTTANKVQLASVWIQEALDVVATPMDDSPGALRLVSRDAGENHASHNLADNGCGTAGAYVFCEYAVLNKANTHESRVHHVETPGGIQAQPGFVPVDVGYVWITELAYQLNHGNSDVQGMVGNRDITDLGIPNTGGEVKNSDGVNGDKIYSLALLATSDNKEKGRAFINFLRSTEGQLAYTNGGFTGLTEVQLRGGKCYGVPTEIHDPAFAGNSGPLIVVSAATNRTGDGSCADWLENDTGGDD